jgi:hypothetical protein
MFKWTRKAMTLVHSGEQADAETKKHISDIKDACSMLMKSACAPEQLAAGPEPRPCAAAGGASGGAPVSSAAAVNNSTARRSPLSLSPSPPHRR